MKIGIIEPIYKSNLKTKNENPKQNGKNKNKNRNQNMEFEQVLRKEIMK